MSNRDFTDESKIALVGVGYWGSKLLRNIVTVVGLERTVAVDGNMDALKEAYRTFPGIATVQTLEDALIDPLVAAVVVATHAASHRDVAFEALNAGCHVLIEKPLATTSVQAKEIVDLADRLDRVVMVGHTFLFSPRVEKLAALVGDKTTLGDVHYLTSSRLNLGLFRPDANVIWDLGPHDVSIILHLLNESPTQVQTAARDFLGDGVPDVAFINMWFPSGVIARVDLSWMAPVRVRSVVIVGSNSMIHFDDADAAEPIKVFDKGVDETVSDGFAARQLTYRHGDTVVPFIDGQEPLQRQIRSFVDAMTTGQVRVSGGAFSLEVVRALEAADRSWELGGQAVQLDPTPVP